MERQVITQKKSREPRRLQKRGIFNDGQDNKRAESD